MNISKYKTRNGKIEWMVESPAGDLLGLFPTLRQAKNAVRWWGDKPQRRPDLDFSSCLFLKKTG